MRRRREDFEYLQQIGELEELGEEGKCMVEGHCSRLLGTFLQFAVRSSQVTENHTFQKTGYPSNVGQPRTSYIQGLP